MKLVNLTHANTGDIILVNPFSVFYTYYSSAHRAVAIVSVQGAPVIVKESLEQVSSLLDQASNNNPITKDA